MTHVGEQSTTFNPETLPILGSALDDACSGNSQMEPSILHHSENTDHCFTVGAR
jgi:hypothetical protein